MRGLLVPQAISIHGRGSLRAEIARQVALRTGRTKRHPDPPAVAAAAKRITNWHLAVR